MNYTDMINTLKTASLFDLYRLSIAITHEMENPSRITMLRESFKEGDVVTYFDKKTNTLISAVVLQKCPKYVLVKNTIDQRKWKIPYFCLNLSNDDTDIYASSGKLSKNNIKVGECVGFNHDGEQIAGIVVRLNQRTVSLITNNNQHWRVHYGALFKIIDADVIQSFDSKKIASWVQRALIE